MRFLHTSDWHLGQRLHGLTRHEEHQHFLEWLLQQIEVQKIEVLLMSGDVFDNANPPQEALQLYYDFLSKMVKTQCKSVIIVGGNHDSINVLNAPRRLLKPLNIHIIGGAALEEELIEIYNTQKQIEAVVCAVPFLRDKDLRYSIAGESEAEKERRIKQGIFQHYQKIKEKAVPYKEKGVLVIAMGHLFATGAETSESEKLIHVGNLGQVSAQDFPEEFEYVALGHLHRPQIVGNFKHIRYAGSPIPLSFSEAQEQKQAVIVDCNADKLVDLTSLDIPQYRTLRRIKGDAEAIKKELKSIQHPSDVPALWVEVVLQIENPIVGLKDELHKIIKDKNINLLSIKYDRKYQKRSLSQQIEPQIDLTELTASEVFTKRCEGLPNSEELQKTFDELLSMMGENVK